MTVFPQSGKKPTKTCRKADTGYSKISSTIIDGKSCSTLTKITINPELEDNVNFHIHANTNLVLSPKYWSRLLPYLHITILYILIIFLYLELRTTQQSMHEFHLSILNVSIRNMELDVACSEQLHALKKAVSRSSPRRSRRSISEGLSAFVLPDPIDSSSLTLGSSPYTAIEKFGFDGKRIIRSPQRRSKGRGKPDKQRRNKRPRKVPLSVFLKGAQPVVHINDDGFIAPWYVEPQPQRMFDLSEKFDLIEGKSVVKVSETGLYLIYAQVYYLTVDKLNSYSMSLESLDNTGEKILSTCSVWGPGNGTGEVSCFTAVVRPLSIGDRLYLKQRERNRTILLRDGQTFLGLVLLSPKKQAQD